jgi:hypothetical protein
MCQTHSTALLLPHPMLSRSQGTPEMRRLFFQNGPGTGLEKTNMRENWSTAIRGSRVLLVPYRRRHVAKYHAWMQDTAIQEVNALQQSLCVKHAVCCRAREPHK